MAIELKNNEIVLFKNNYKTKDVHPHFKGKCLVEGIEKDASCWVNTSKKGDKYLKIKLDKPYVKEGESSNTSTSNVAEFDKEEIPF